MLIIFAEKSRYTLLILIEESIGKAENESAFEVRVRFEEIKRKGVLAVCFSKEERQQKSTHLFGLK